MALGLPQREWRGRGTWTARPRVGLHSTHLETGVETINWKDGQSDLVQLSPRNRDAWLVQYRILENRAYGTVHFPGEFAMAGQCELHGTFTAPNRPPRMWEHTGGSPLYDFAPHHHHARAGSDGVMNRDAGTSADARSCANCPGRRFLCCVDHCALDWNPSRPRFLNVT